jgi:outer membrane protein
MKKLMITAAIVIAAMATGNAQMFIGGGLGLDFTSSKSEEGSSSEKGPKTLSFEITPKVGYYLNDKMAIGLELGFLNASTKSDVPSVGGTGTQERKVSVTAFGINAFGRYHLAEVDKFALILEASLGFQTGKAKTKTGSEITEGDPTNRIGLFVLPVLSYSISDRLSLEANCDFLRFGFGRETEKHDGTGEGDLDTKDSQTYFGFGVNNGSSEIYQLANPTPFSVGVVWKF